MKKLVAISAITCLVLFIFIFVEVFLFLTSVPSHEKLEKVISIERGSSFLKVAKQLKKEGVITHEIKFYLLAKWEENVSKIKAGEYLLYTNLKPGEVLDALVSGRTYLHKLTIPEGYNIFQVAEEAQSLSLVLKEEFLAIARDPSFIASLNIVGSSIEGYLFPESYYFSKPVTPQKIIETMVSKFNENYTEEIVFRAQKVGLTKEQVVVLASMIEKETGVPWERHLISAVFHNRLKKGIKFQSDPTVIYGIFETFRGNLTKKDLLTPTLYNTYVKEGFPIGPIANPGKASLEAAVTPAPVDYLYFVSKNDGSHIFSRTYREHINAVNLYQKQKSP